MSYKEKKTKKDFFRSSLYKLFEFAHQTPVLSLNSRRAIVASIYLGGKAGCSKEGQLVPELAGKSHRFTQNGLTNALSEKLSPDDPALSDAIMKLSSLSAWAFSHPYQCQEIMESFAKDMAPEDITKQINSPIRSVISALNSNWGIPKTSTLLTSSLQFWIKKYRQR